jgi:hypothetical protein
MEDVSNKVCFICATPYHLIVASAIAMSEKLNADLFVLDEFMSCEQIAENIRNIELFDQVRIIDNDISKNSAYKKIRITYTLLFNKLVMERYLVENYKELYIFHRDHAYVKAACLYLKSKNPELTINLYDEGIGSYCNEQLFKQGNITRYLELLFCKKQIKNDDLSIFLFSPDLYIRGFKNHPPIHNISKICGLNKIDGYSNAIKKVFKSDKDEEISWDVLAFDTVRNEELTETGIEIFEASLDYCKNLFNKMKVKKHPRAECSKKFDYFVYDSPFELLCFDADLSDKVFISSFSSALFSPKLLFDMEPTVVFLFDVLKDVTKVKYDHREVVEYLREIYTDKSKVIIPKDIADLKAKMIELKKNRNL